MKEYIMLKDLAGHLHLNKGDNVYVTSDVKQLLYDCIQHEDGFSVITIDLEIPCFRP